MSILSKPKISVILPVYNVEKFLKQCLDSLVNQSFKDFELICVNDGSTDASCEILKEYAEKDKRIRIINCENGGVACARNIGLKKAKGNYIICLDSDDFFEEDMLKKLFDKAIKTNADIILFQYKTYDNNTGEHSEARGVNLKLLKNLECFSKEDLPDSIMSVTRPNVWTKFYKTRFIKKNKLFYQVIPNAEDEYFTYLALCLAEKITYLEDALVNYRIGRQDSLEDRKAEFPLCFIEADRALFDELKKRGLFQKVKRSYANRVIEHCVYALWKMQASPEAVEQVRVTLKTDFLPYTGVLNYPDKCYENLEYVKKLRQL
ncbi:MAG: glycosyltransferase family 2 protein [Eubacterium sp.]|nr:glycosyltransferase family 2 protein [Eubacterium sp.]